MGQALTEMLRDVFTPTEWALLIGVGALFFSAAFYLPELL